MTDLAVHFSSGKDDWSTPDSVFRPLHEEFGFDVDAAANEHNTRMNDWFGPGGLIEDALYEPWSDYGSSFWCNPPYSRGLQSKFVAKAAAERLMGVQSVLLLPARTDTRMFHDHIWDRERFAPREGVEVRFVKGRIKFVGAAAGAPFPSMVVVFRP